MQREERWQAHSQRRVPLASGRKKTGEGHRQRGRPRCRNHDHCGAVLTRPRGHDSAGKNGDVRGASTTRTPRGLWFRKQGPPRPVGGHPSVAQRRQPRPQRQRHRRRSDLATVSKPVNGDRAEPRRAPPPSKCHPSRRCGDCYRPAGGRYRVDHERQGRPQASAKGGAHAPGSPTKPCGAGCSFLAEFRVTG